MKTVNQLIFGHKMTFRPEYENNMLIDTILDELWKPENIHMQDMIRNLQKKRIRNLGERGSAELLGAISIYMTQVKDKNIPEIEKSRRMRDEW